MNGNTIMNAPIPGDRGRNSYWKRNWKYIAGVVLGAAIVTLPKVLHWLWRGF